MITENLGVTWPEVEEPLRADLCARGVPPETARDVCQEVAIRALTAELEFTDAGELLRWARVVGRRLAIDHYRVQARLLVGDVPDRAAPQWTEDVVSDRLAVSAVASALADLTVEERTLLLDEGTAPTRREQVRLAVRRHRLRQRLLDTIGAAMGWVTGVKIGRGLSRRTVTFGLVMPLLVGILLVPDHRVAPLAPAADPLRPTTVVDRDQTPLRVASGSVPATTTTTVAPDDSPLAPLHGAEVDPPTRIVGPVGWRERTEDDKVVCLNDWPVIGDWCTPI